MEAVKKFRQYRVVLLAQAAAVFKHEAGFKLDIQGDQTHIDLRCWTRFDEMSSGDRVNREICLEANLDAEGIDRAVDEARRAAEWFAPLLAFVANAEVTRPIVHLAFETTENICRREFLQFHYPEQKQPPGLGRFLDLGHLTAVVDAYNVASEPRVWRSLAQYNFALGHWFEGSEFLALSHLWMAIETLLPLIVTDVCRADSMTIEELADAYGIDRGESWRWKGQLGSRVRLEQIFQGDQITHKLAKAASDGLEHGFAEGGVIQTNAVAACDKVFQYVRTAILGHLQIPPLHAAEMGPKAPIDARPAKKFVSAYLCGEMPVDQLAADGEMYPKFLWTTSIKGVKDHGDRLDVTLDENFVMRFGTGISVENFQMATTRRPATGEAQSPGASGPAGTDSVP